MGTLALIVLIVLLLIVVAGVVFAVALARRSKAQLAAGMSPAPGMAGDAPAEWAGQHTPEAKMHRRLNELARTLDALPLGDASAIERQVALRQRVQELDRLLIALAGAPDSARRDAVAALAPKVDAAETEIGALATEPPTGWEWVRPKHQATLLRLRRGKSVDSSGNPQRLELDSLRSRAVRTFVGHWHSKTYHPGAPGRLSDSGS